MTEKKKSVQVEFICTGYFAAEPPVLSPYVTPIPIPTTLPLPDTGSLPATFTDVSLMTIARLPLICWKIRLYQTREARREKEKLDIDLLMQKVRAMAVFVTSYEDLMSMPRHLIK